MLQNFVEIGDAVLAAGGHVSFEWPRHCSGWILPELMYFIHRHNLFVADVDGCACGMTDSKGEPMLKKWRFITSSERQAQSLSSLRCQHHKDFVHSEISGSKTKGTERYPDKLCHTMLSSLFGHWHFVPAMPCIDIQDYGHVEPAPANGFGATLSTVNSSVIDVAKFASGDDLPPLVGEEVEDLFDYCPTGTNNTTTTTTAQGYAGSRFCVMAQYAFGFLLHISRYANYNDK